MDRVIDKTKLLIKAFEDSDIIRNLDHYKTLVVNNKKLLELIDKYNNSTDDYEKISLKKKIYTYPEYKEYMKYYNELFYYVMNINNRFKKYTFTKFIFYNNNNICRCFRCIYFNSNKNFKSFNSCNIFFSVIYIYWNSYNNISIYAI